MTKENKLSFNFIYKILLSISIIIASICLIWGCLDIYFSDGGYSRQIIIDTFAKIYIPIYICLALIIGNFVIGFIFNEKPKQKFYKIKNFKQNQASKINTKTSIIIKISIILVSVALLIFGAITGGFVDVLTKAVNICTECIGLG